MNEREKTIKDMLKSHKSLLEETNLGAWDIYYTLEEEFLENEEGIGAGGFKVHIRVPKVINLRKSV